MIGYRIYLHAKDGSVYKGPILMPPLPNQVSDHPAMAREAEKLAKRTVKRNDDLESFEIVRWDDIKEVEL